LQVFHRAPPKGRTWCAIVGGALGCLLALPADGMTSAAMGTSFA
jgi:hypothetical protein